MPNWTDTTYKFYGRKEEITRLYNAVRYATDKENMNYGHLSCILQYLGVEQEKISDMYLRGHVTWVEDPVLLGDENFLQFQFDCEEAWGTCQDFHTALKSLFSGDDEHVGMVMDYRCTEPGSEVYEHSEGFDERYYTYVDSESEWNTWYDDDSLLEYINTYYEQNFGHLIDALSWLKETREKHEEEGRIMDVYEFSIVEF